MCRLRPWQTRTHCCGHIVADTNVSPFARARNICCGHKFCVRDTKNVSDFVQKHSVSTANVSQFAQPKKHHGQQCVRNNVSSFTRAFRIPLIKTSRMRQNSNMNTFHNSHESRVPVARVRTRGGRARGGLLETEKPRTKMSQKIARISFKTEIKALTNKALNVF